MTRRSWHRSLAIRAIVTLGFCALLSGAARADDASDGRRHAQRASHLAAKGKCRQAIAEYDKAIPSLKDPALFFNRAECHRKVGNTDAAVSDYSRFLQELPGAPNRVEVESRIAELKKAPVVVPGPDAAPIAQEPALDTKPALQSGAGAEPSPIEKAFAGPVPTQPPASPETTAPTPTNPTDSAVIGSLSAPPASNETESSLLAAHRDVSPAAPDTNDAAVNHPWVWVAVGVVVVAAGVSAFLILGRHDTTIPTSDLGNYKF